MATTTLTSPPSVTAPTVPTPFKPRPKYNIARCRFCDDREDSIPKTVEDVSNGVVVCTKCGAIIEPIIDERSEWRTFSDDTENRSRVGYETDTFFDGVDRLDVSISKMDGGTGKSRELNRIAAKNSMTSDERAMKEAFNEIKKLCDQIRLPPHVVDDAKLLFKKHGGALKGHTDWAIAAAIHLACRLKNCPRSLKETCALTGVTKKDLGRAVKRMDASVKAEKKALAPNAAKAASSKASQDFFPVMEAETLVPRYCQHLKLDPVTTRAATALIKKAKDLGLEAAKSPVSVAAAAIYMISQVSSQPKSAEMVASKVGVAQATLKGVYKGFYPYRHDIIPKDFPLSKPIESLPPVRVADNTEKVTTPSSSEPNSPFVANATPV